MLHALANWFHGKPSSRAARKRPVRQPLQLRVKCLEERELLSATVPGFTLSSSNLYNTSTSHQQLIDTGVQNFSVANNGVNALQPRNGTLVSMNSNQSAKAPPAAPAFTATAVSGTQINLSWKGVAGASGYLVDEWINGSWKQIASLGSGSTSVSVTGLNPGTTYYFDVAAYNAAGTTWANYQTAATFQSAPAAPAFTATVVSGMQINLSWNGVAGATGYQVDEWINGSWKQIASLGSTSTSASVTGLNAGTTYYFDVAAYNAAGTTWANYQSATTFQVAPAAPSFTATAVSGTQINLSWNGVAGASGYLVDESVNGAWTQVASLGSGSTSASVTGLSPGTTYYFKVGAFNSSGTTWANYQSVTTTTNPTQNATSSNWSGYVITPGTQVNAVGGSWVVPAVSGAAGFSSSSVWVGIDGWGSSTVEQIGTEENYTNGQPSYSAWVEFYGDKNAQGATGRYYSQYDITSLNIHAGDTIVARVSFVANTNGTSTFRFDIQDTPINGGLTEAWGSTLTTQYVVPARATAEWIAEATTYGTEPALANFGTVRFTGAWATAGATTGPINAFPNYAVKMSDPAGGGTSYPTALVDSNTMGPYEFGGVSSSGFTVSYASTASGSAASAIVMANNTLVSTNVFQQGTAGEAAADLEHFRTSSLQIATDWQAEIDSILRRRGPKSWQAPQTSELDTSIDEVFVQVAREGGFEVWL